MASKVNRSIRDFGSEVGTYGYTAVQLTAANHDAQIALHAAEEAALANICRGEIAKRRIIHTAVNVSNDDAADDEAQREELLYVQYEDANKNMFGFEIPCVDISALTRITGTDFVNLADAGVMAAYVTALEAAAVSPKDGTSAITVLRAILVGARS